MKKFKENAIFFIVYFAFWLADALLVPYLGLFYVERGLGGAQIALLSIVESVISPLAAIFIGFIMNGVKGKKAFFMGLPVGMSVAALLMYMSGGFGGIVVGIAGLYFCRSPFSGLVDRVIMGRLHDHPQDYGIFRLGGSVGYGIGALIAGMIYAAFSCRPLFFMYIPACLITGLSCLGMPLGEDSGETTRPNLKEMFNVKALLSGSGFLKIYGTLTLFGIISAVTGKYMAIYAVQQGRESSITGTMIAFAMIGEIVMFLVFPVISKKFSPEFSFFLGFLFYIIRIVSVMYIATLPVWLIMVMQIIGGAEFSVVWAAATSLVETSYPPEAGFLAQTLKSVFHSSVGYSIGCVLLSVFYDSGKMKLGMGVLFVINAVCLIYYGLLSAKGLGKNANGSETLE